VAVRSPEDGSGRLFIVQQAGVIRILVDGALLPTPFLDISSLVVCCGERGLLGLAFHPDFTTNGYFFVYYVEVEPEPPPDCSQPGGCQENSAIVRYQVSADPNVADPASATRILTVNQPNIQHQGGNLLFGPDGYLYVGLGDGNGLDPSNAQPLDRLLGKMLRLDVDSAPDGDCGIDADYAVPPDNPYAGPGPECGAIWVSGLRNPWRWSFDRLTGDILIGDVGAGHREEVDFLPATSSGGENFGWPCMEGDFELGFECLPGTLTPPILVYPHGPGCAIIGGYRYRGKAMPEWYGDYFFADLCTTTVFVAREDAGTWSVVALLDVSAQLPGMWTISSFAEDADGELLLVQRVPGAVWHFQQRGLLFCDGFESGDTSRW
jgi:glucose/arabinose dehydrogenase